VESEHRLLEISFESVEDYEIVVSSSCRAAASIGKQLMFYSAAAVSDFYVPSNSMAEHKIQSSEGGMKMNFHPVASTEHHMLNAAALFTFVLTVFAPISFRLLLRTSMFTGSEIRWKSAQKLGSRSVCGVL